MKVSPVSLMHISTDAIPDLPEWSPLSHVGLSPSKTAGALAGVQEDVDKHVRECGENLHAHVGAMRAFVQKVRTLDSEWGAR
ncbi:hypothetical protein [Corynebacterium aquatimens]|uniref:Uncharacterized protein n=1 Tax=Corynebacterium aquatimens TaxID=1190508 RepID=A0A931E2W6_9CORY|nr:hypothetical protein [Corynebacterium aquatimens]MBG6122947.1 hypothetical protein [Corynebacterium aquatimens]WJY66718.1 hypothetical protein CAQUA_10155 [Corynebacterium aquatimens]